MTIETRPTFLRARFATGSHCPPFDGGGAFLLTPVPASVGLRARWAGRCWVHDPNGREALVRVVLMETLAGEFFVGVMPTEADAVPVFVFLKGIDGERLAFGIGPADLLGAGAGVTLTIAPVV